MVIDTLVALHRVDPACVDLDTLGRPEGFAARQLDGWTKRWHAAKDTDLDDFEILRANYLTGATFEQGDANLDGTVDHEDFFMWRTDYLMLGGDPALINFQAIPEPSTLSLVALAVIGTLRRARHR